MKKKMMSLALALVMCMTLCVPAFASDNSDSTPTAPDLVIDASEMDTTTSHYYSKTFIEDGRTATLELIYQPSLLRSGSESYQATVGTWTTKYNSVILTMSYKFDVTRSGSQWKVSNARDHRYSAIGYSTSNPSLKIVRSVSTEDFPAEIDASLQYTLVTDLLFTMTGILNTTISSNGTLTVSWN